MMSKRKTTPQLPSMDDLLGGQTKPDGTTDSKASKSRDSWESENKVKVTYYLPADLVERIDDAHYQLNRAARGSGRKIHKYDMARIAWQIVLEAFEQDSENSELARYLFKDF